MIPELVEQFMAKKPELEAVFSAKHPDDYRALVYAVVVALNDGGIDISPERIHEIDDGDYQGTLLYVIAVNGYHPSNYWYTKVVYGSCNGCDTLDGIRGYGYSNKKPTAEQVGDYMTLALHIVQGMKKMGGNDD